MLLNVTNNRTSPVAIQSPDGSNALSFTVVGSGTITGKQVTSGQLGAIEPTLKALVAAGHIAYSVSEDPTSAADDILLNVTTATATPYAAVAGDRYIVTNKVASGAHSVVLLDTAPLGIQVTVADLKGDAGTNNVTITVANSGTINGGANLVLSTNRQGAILTKIGANAWVGFRVTV